MPKRVRVKKVVVRIAHEELEEEKQGVGKVVERFFIPLKPFQLQPLPIEPNIPKIAPRLSGLGGLGGLGGINIGGIGAIHDIRELRQLLSDEKARILAVVKARKPESLYKLAKFLGRDFKAVRSDVKLLEKFGFLKLVREKDKKGKKKLRPLLAIDKLQVTIEV